MHVSIIHAYTYIDERIADAGALCAHRRAHVVRRRVCLCACGFWANTYSRRNVRALSGGLDRVWAAAWSGSQAFCQASTFNANIGAWNTARVTDLSSVCAALGRQRAERALSISVFDAARPVCAGAPPMRAHECAHTYTYMHTCIHPSIHPSIHTYIHTYLSIYLSKKIDEYMEIDI
jgi:hypothetical protein